MSERKYRLGPAAVLAEMERAGVSAGCIFAVRALYDERDQAAMMLRQSNEVVEYLLKGGDPAAVAEVSR